jgi:hypothetical protein
MMKFKVGFFIEVVLGDITFHIELTRLKSKWYSSMIQKPIQKPKEGQTSINLDRF